MSMQNDTLVSIRQLFEKYTHQNINQITDHDI